MNGTKPEVTQEFACKMQCRVVGAFLYVCDKKGLSPQAVWGLLDPLLAKHGLGPDDRDFINAVCAGSEFLTCAKCQRYGLRKASGTPLADAFEELTGEALPDLRAICTHLDSGR